MNRTELGQDSDVESLRSTSQVFRIRDIFHSVGHGVCGSLF